MKKNTVIALLLILFLTGSCTSFKQIRYMSKGKAPKGTFRTEVPFELRNGLIIMKVKLNDSDKEFEFMLDTGAPASVIYKEALDESKADTVMTYEVSDSRGNSIESAYVMLDMTIGKSQFKDIFTVCVSEPSEFVRCIARGGIIGADLMQTANWEIDQENRKIVITDFKSGLPDLSGYQKVSCSKRAPLSSMPWLTILPGLTVDLKINGKKIKDVYVDSGSSGGLTLPKNKETDTLFKNEQKSVMWGYSSFGLLGGSMDTTYYYTDVPVDLGNVHVPHPSIDVYQRGSSLLGMSVLSDYMLFIDFRKKNLYLKPRTADVQKNTDEKEFGFYLYYDSQTKECTVASLFEGSAAAHAGLKLGDTIVELNNKKLPDFADFCEFREWSRGLAKFEGPLLVKIKRDDQEMNIEKALVPKR